MDFQGYEGYTPEMRAKDEAAVRQQQAYLDTLRYDQFGRGRRPLSAKQLEHHAKFAALVKDKKIFRQGLGAWIMGQPQANRFFAREGRSYRDKNTNKLHIGQPSFRISRIAKGILRVGRKRRQVIWDELMKVVPPNADRISDGDALRAQLALHKIKAERIKSRRRPPRYGPANPNRGRGSVARRPISSFM